MKISPISFGYAPTQKTSVSKETVKHDSNYIPTTTRRNSLADYEFNIIADTIKSQNLKNQMYVRLATLKRSLNSRIANDAYSQ